jgi:AcrR family transcriptional regulator
MAEPESRDRILFAARDLFVTEGYEHTTVARIRADSGVSNGTLFHHFPTKEAILDAIYTEAMKRINVRYFAVLESSPGSLRELLRGFIDAILSFAVEEQDNARIVYYLGPLDADSQSKDELDAESLELIDAVRNALSPYQASGEVKNVPVSALLPIIQGPAHLIAKYWLADTGQFPAPTNLVEVFTDAAVAGLTGSPSGSSPPIHPTSGQIAVHLVDQDGNRIASGSAMVDLAAEQPHASVVD